MAQVRVRNSSTFRIAESAARTATTNFGSSNGFVPPKGVNAVRIYIEATASAATPSVVFNVQVRDPLNDQWHTILASAAVTGTGRTFLEVGPGIAAVANQSAGKYIGKGFRVNATAADADSLTYNIVGEWTA